MSQVHRLDDNTINQIAAGEVIERPSSVVKELVENSIDAGATRIEVEIRNGGRQLIRVTDNGRGMEREDAILAVERHTTSKLNEPNDLWSLKTLGFRGEALPSIASVSRFEMITKTESVDLGTIIEMKSGLLHKAKDTGAPNGTTIKVHDLFFNTPARFKYLKTIPTETSYISEIMARLALGYPEISFKLQHHDCELLFTTGNGDLYETIVAIFGKTIAKEMISIQHQENGIKLSGFIGKPSIARNNRSYEIFFVNRRYFHSRIISTAVEKAYHTLLPIARFPFAVLSLEIDQNIVDINAHPSKLEVRFANEQEIFKPFYHSIQQVLRDNSLLSEWMNTDQDLSLRFTQTPTVQPKPVNTQIVYEELSATAQQTALSIGEAFPVPQLMHHSDGHLPQGSIETDLSQPLRAVAEQDNIQAYYIFPKAIQNTYIVAQDEKGLLFIDQHAAHERILYERYSRKANEFLGTQNLLIAETVNKNNRSAITRN